MAAEQRKLLEALMGDQLMSSNSRAPQVSITDPKVCRSYLVGTCPHDLFTNTRQDLGVCPKVHSEALKTEFDAADEQQKAKWGFEFDYLRDMAKYIDSCNRRIDDARRKLEKTPEEIRKTTMLLQEINRLTKNIENGLLEIKILGELGSVNIAVTEYLKIRQAKAKKEEHERELKAISDTSGPSGHQKLQVCDVCGAYLSRLDNDRRLADHFFGKMHLGYAQMRKTHDALKEQLRDRKPPFRDEPMGNGYGPRGGYDDGPYNNRGYGRGGGGGGGYRGGRGRGRW
ncbi:LUC7-domain-containing protein [Myriangium duriaei CBS 260.36]|uniref:LUC7-domain-containing protein n=1 Tax=Myriangium duriaei CBS 260.36 TaxID=1168546 RepID=A0A9P4MGY1_9PEZI|nr:LUC7-domain-containing protein [Myriangium duriaei CBS 260.36]